MASKLSVFLAELKRRKVTRVAVVYAVVGAALAGAANDILPRLLLPEWTVTFVVVLALLGFPVALLLAWFFDITSEGIQRAAGPPSVEAAANWQSIPRATKILAALAVPGAVAVAVALTLRLASPPDMPLDPRRVVVYPLEESGRMQSPDGEDAATWIGYVLETSANIQWIDGWYALNRVQQAGLGSLVPADTRRNAMAQGAGFLVRGRISHVADSVHILIDLLDVASDSVLARGSAGGLDEDGWTKKVSEDAAREILRVLPANTDSVHIVSPSDTSVAVRHFLEGERLYRRSQFENALEQYRSAVGADSAFALAGIKGILAVQWKGQTAEAEEFLSVIRERSALLSPRFVHLAEGLDHYMEGRADEAVASIERALFIAPEWLEARAKLGEVYTYLLPGRSPLDSLAEAAFREVHERDPDFTPVLWQLIQFALLKGEIAQAKDYLQQYREAQPDSGLLASAEMMTRCVEAPNYVDWEGAVREDADAVYRAADFAAVGALQSDCARAAWWALINHDTASLDESVARRFTAHIGLHSLLVAEGRTEEAFGLLRSSDEFSAYTGDFALLDAAAGVDVGELADNALPAFTEPLRRGDLFSIGIWFLGSFLAERGDAARAQALADTLALRASISGDRTERLLAETLAARSALARGDTLRALALLRQLVPTKRWREPPYVWEMLGGEHILLAEILFSRGGYEEVIRLTANFDAPARTETDLIFLPRALELRLHAAEALGDTPLVRRCRERIRRLGRADLLESR